MMSRATSALLTFAVTLSMGCAAAEGDPEPALEAGTSDSSTFTAYTENGSIEVFLDTEVRIRPTLRYQGFAGRPSVRCTAFDLDRDRFLAEQRSYETAIERGNWTHVPYDMLVQLPDEEVEDATEMQTYDGDRVLFQCRADDEFGNSAVISHEMTISVR